MRVCMCMCVCMILYNSACTSHPLKHAYLQCVLFHLNTKNSGWIPRIEEPYICCTTGLHDTAFNPIAGGRCNYTVTSRNGPYKGGHGRSVYFSTFQFLVFLFIQRGQFRLGLLGLCAFPVCVPFRHVDFSINGTLVCPFYCHFLIFRLMT